jgi:hypothetical protein
MRLSRPVRLLVPLVAALSFSLTPSSAFAQAFGKNKVQYEPLHWAVLETPHIRLHYYAEEESLARRLAAAAESVCVEYDRRFRLEFRHSIPILLYSAHQLFQQTNATPGLISESVGGITELIKGRVLIPHNGSWSRLEWVTRHELTHAYMLEKLARVMKDHHRTQGYLPPLWFIEGLAEYCGTHWDADAEGLLRDAVISNRALPLTRSEPIIGTVLMYKEGQSFLLYLAEHFGPDKVFDLLDNWYRADDFETAFRLTFGRRLPEVDREWFADLKRHYYPAIADAQTAPERGQRLTRRGHFNLGPRALPSASARDTTVRFCYFAARESGVELVLSEPGKKGRRRERRLLRAGQSPSFESFHLFRNRPDASASGVVALSSKRGGRDALYLVDGTGRVMRRLEFPHLVAILDPSIVPGDQAVVFSAQEYGGRSDLYRASWPEGRVHLERLTNDDFDDLEPDVSPDGRFVAFASDRGPDGRYAIFRLALAGGVPEPISRPVQGDDRQPVYSPDGRWIAFRSTRGGTSDLYVRPAEPSQEARRVTRLVGPAYDPDWIPSGRGLLFTGQDRVEFQAYQIAFDPDSLSPELETPSASDSLPLQLALDGAAETRHETAVVYHTGPRRPYERRLGLDLIQNGIAFDPGLGGAGGGQIAMSDVLGNEQFHFFLANDADRFGNFWDGFEGGVTYINQGQRLNYGLGIFRLTQVYDADLDAVRRERRFGILGLARYPFSKFTRVEGSVVIRHASDHLLRSGTFQDVDLVSHYLSLVHDNSGWTQLGPSVGSRWILSAGFTRDLTSGAGDFTTLLGEVRHYVLPIPVIVSATRVQAQSTFGEDAQHFYLGGATSLRGYDRRELSGQRTLLVQQEFRLPLLRGLTLAVPAPWELPTISAAGFADVAWAWNVGDDRRLGSVGTAVYFGGVYFPAVRWNFSWTTTDFVNFSPRPRTQFMIGFNF